MDTINLMKGFLALGNLDKDQSIAEKVAYKQRIVFATMRASIPQWEPPTGWEDLPLEARLERLTKLEEIA